MAFIERHTLQGIEIGRVRRRDMPEYPVEAVREAVINAVVHADYSIGGAGTKVAVFDGSSSSGAPVSVGSRPPARTPVCLPRDSRNWAPTSG